MYSHGSWDGCGSGEHALPDDLIMAFFDSPLSEMNESHGDEIDLNNTATDFFGGDFAFDTAFDNIQGGGFPPLSGSVESLDVNAQLAACFDFNDPLLYPDGGDLVNLGLDMMDFDAFTPDLIMSPGQFTSSVDASPFSRLSDGSALTTATSPASPSEAGATHPFRCATDGCTKTFRKESQLKQHQRVHKKALVCLLCLAEHQTEHKFAQVRDLERHLQARHRDVAERANVRSETRECPSPGCDHRGRRDNVSRHYESKHGGKLRWRKGVPSVV